MSELQHFGVKGMKWGVRKAEEPANPAYTKGMRANDLRKHGKRGVRRINRRMNEGMSRDDALRKEYDRNRRQFFTAIGAAYTARLLLVLGPHILQSAKIGIAVKAHNSRLRANWATRSDVLGLPSKASKLNYAKASRGVFNITTMK